VTMCIARRVELQTKMRFVVPLGLVHEIEGRSRIRRPPFPSLGVERAGILDPLHARSLPHRGISVGSSLIGGPAMNHVARPRREQVLRVVGCPGLPSRRGDYRYPKNSSKPWTVGKNRSCRRGDSCRTGQWRSPSIQYCGCGHWLRLAGGRRASWPTVVMPVRIGSSR